MTGHCWHGGIWVNPLPVLLQHPWELPCPRTCPLQGLLPSPSGTDLLLPTFQDATSEGELTVTASRRILQDLPPKG